MKKLLTLILALSMALALCGCGGGGETAEEATPEAEDGSIVFEEPVLVHEDDVLRMELTEFYEEEVNWADKGPAIEKYVTFKITNLSDHEFVVGCDFYLGADHVRYSIQNTNGSPAAGKSGYMTFGIQYDDGKDGVALKSLDELYQLEGTIDVLKVYEDSSRNNRYEFSFSFPELLGNGAEEPEQGSTENSDAALSNGTVTIDAICVDDSYRDKNESPLRMVYLFCTLTPESENLKVDSHDAKLTIENSNSYTAEHYPDACDYAPNYYYGDWTQEVYMGDTCKLAMTFKIPEADLAAGRSVTLSDSQIPDLAELSFSTDDIQHCDGTEAVGKAADPEGYAAAVTAREPADAATTAKAKGYLAGYYWSFYVNSTAYEIEFYANDTYDLRTPLGTTSGTYAITNGYVVVTNGATGAVNEIPYTFSSSDIELEVADGFDVKEN